MRYFPKTKKPAIKDELFIVSGYQDLNLGPPAPKAGALPDCATSRRLGVGVGCESVGVVSAKKKKAEVMPLAF